MGRYREEFDRLASKQVAVYAFDAHCFGRSQPSKDKRGDITDFEHFVYDVEKFVRVVKGKQPNKPTYLGGHSLGGLISTKAVLRNQKQYAGLVLSSAALDVKRNFALKLLSPFSGVAAALIPKARIAPAVNIKDLSIDQAVIDKYVADENVFNGPVRARFAHLAKLAIDELMPQYSAVTIPIYAFHGTKDNIAPIEAVDTFITAVTSKDTTMKQFPGGFHELVHGPEKTEAFDGLAAWLHRDRS